ncbi:hypothetical protein BDR03DRAFT_976282 [Suillus americanus]|nr:hypothetical protein BDR03DRAFT_976282 [Suillus americanus]
MDCISIVPILTTYATSQNAVATRQIVLWERKPVIKIANIKQCRDQATKNMGVTIDNK